MEILPVLYVVLISCLPSFWHQWIQSPAEVLIRNITLTTFC